ncbi:MAG TPA: Rne/Rng family ribonuclease [Chlamydiales bacterium]|nr:Rne/Rng family ribonuclease [Chlamydiales bacterium]
MMQEILLNVESKEIRLAQLKFGKLHDLVIERKKSRQITGNIYRGKVTNILDNIQSAFIDINEGENGFIHINDILENTKKFEEMYEMDFEAEKVPKKKKETINELLSLEQPVLVQVVKESIGTKGARLTSNISIAGRYLVLLPNTPHRGVSRKIENRTLRDKLKKLIKSFEMPKDLGIICRTASAHATAEMLISEATELFETWETIVSNFNKAKNPMCIYEESDLIKKAMLLAVDKKYDRILVDDYTTYLKLRKHYKKYQNEHDLKIEYYRDKLPMFERFNVEREIDKALRRKVWLSSGGYLYLDHTEAMFTIDVNSGRSTKSGQNKTSDVEESLVRINLEAAEEIARQFRIRNIGGLIVCDFIDMRSRKNQRRVIERLKECMKEDSAKCTILGMSEFGLIEMTRQRQRESLSQMMLTSCPYCHGRGAIKCHETVALEIERVLKKLIYAKEQYALEIVVHPQFLEFLEKEDDLNFLISLASKENAKIKFETNDNLHLNDFKVLSSTSKEELEV